MYEQCMHREKFGRDDKLGHFYTFIRIIQIFHIRNVQKRVGGSTVFLKFGCGPQTFFFTFISG